MKKSTAVVTMDERYNIYFAGVVLEGHDIAQVRLKLGELFNADDLTLDKLFSGDAQMIKRSCDKSTALKYQQAMKKVGAKPVIRAAQPAAHEQSNLDFDLAPVGADMLRPEERPEAEALEIDTSALSLADTGERLSDLTPAAPAAPDTDHLSMGDIGEDIPNLDNGTPPPPPDTTGISMSPEDSDYSDCAQKPAGVPDLDLSELALADHGADMLDDQYKKEEKPTVPATDHLSLE
ncbi:MAG: hypothetical protein ACJA09_003970 [Alcanivorax sp.]|jgi:hypothetical protein